MEEVIKIMVTYCLPHGEIIGEEELEYQGVSYEDAMMEASIWAKANLVEYDADYFELV